MENGPQTSYDLSLQQKQKSSKRAFILEFQNEQTLQLDADNFLGKPLAESFSFFELINTEEPIKITRYSYKNVKEFFWFMQDIFIFTPSLVLFEEMSCYFGASEKMLSTVIEPIRKIGAERIFSVKTMREFERVYDICFVKYGSDFDRSIAIEQQDIRDLDDNIHNLLSQIDDNVPVEVYDFICDALIGYGFSNQILNQRERNYFDNAFFNTVPQNIQRGEHFAKLYSVSEMNLWFICTNNPHYGRLLFNMLRVHFETLVSWDFYWIEPGLYRIHFDSCFASSRRNIYLATTPCETPLQLQKKYNLSPSVRFEHDNMVYYRRIVRKKNNVESLEFDPGVITGWPRDLPYIFWNPNSKTSTSEILRRSNKYHDPIYNFPNAIMGQICIPIIIDTNWIKLKYSGSYAIILNDEINSHLNMIALQFNARFNGKIKCDTSIMMKYRSRELYEYKKCGTDIINGYLWITVFDNNLKVTLNFAFVATKEEYMNIKSLKKYVEM